MDKKREHLLNPRQVRESLDKLEETHIRKVLATVPNLSEAADILGIDQATLYRKRKRLSLQ